MQKNVVAPTRHTSNHTLSICMNASSFFKPRPTATVDNDVNEPITREIPSLATLCIRILVQYADQHFPWASIGQLPFGTIGRLFWEEAISPRTNCQIAKVYSGCRIAWPEFTAKASYATRRFTLNNIHVQVDKISSLADIFVKLDLVYCNLKPDHCHLLSRLSQLKHLSLAGNPDLDDRAVGLLTRPTINGDPDGLHCIASIILNDTCITGASLVILSKLPLKAIEAQCTLITPHGVEPLFQEGWKLVDVVNDFISPPSLHGKYGLSSLNKFVQKIDRRGWTMETLDPVMLKNFLFCHTNALGDLLVENFIDEVESEVTKISKAPLYVAVTNAEGAETKLFWPSEEPKRAPSTNNYLWRLWRPVLLPPSTKSAPSKTVKVIPKLLNIKKVHYSPCVTRPLATPAKPRPSSVKGLMATILSQNKT